MADYASEDSKNRMTFGQADADVTVDLNGYTLKSGEKTGSYVKCPMIVKAGKVTIVDTYGGGNVNDTIFVNETGELTIENGAINAVTVTSDAKLIINGGTIGTVGGRNTIGNAKVTVNNGTFENISCAGCNVDIYNGTIKKVGASKATYNIYDGTFEQLPQGSGMTVNILGGHFKDAGSYSWNTSTYKFSGGTFGNRTSAFPTKYIATGKKCIQVADKTWSVVDA